MPWIGIRWNQAIYRIRARIIAAHAGRFDNLSPVCFSAVAQPFGILYGRFHAQVTRVGSSGRILDKHNRFLGCGWEFQIDAIRRSLLEAERQLPGRALSYGIKRGLARDMDRI